LEADYYDRAKKEYADEIGLFGRVDSPKWLEATVSGVTNQERLDSYLSNKIEGYLVDDKILTDIDQEIKRLTSGEQNKVS
jgi:hypothetical protein